MDFVFTVEIVLIQSRFHKIIHTFILTEELVFHVSVNEMNGLQHEGQFISANLNNFYKSPHK